MNGEAQELEYHLALPDAPEDGAPVAVLLHGRGADGRDLLGLASGLPAGTLVVTPQAPFPGQPWGYGPGWAWYRYVAEDRVVGETLQESLAALDRFLDRLPDILPVRPGPLFLGGFSQGGTTSLAWSLTRPRRLAGVVNLSGFLADDAAVPVTRASAAHTPVFWGHGIHDPAIPFALARRGRARLAEVGARLETGDYEMGHWIEPGELADVSAWMEEVLEGR